MKRVLQKVARITCEENSHGERSYLFKNYALGFYKNSNLYKRSKKAYQANADQLVFSFAKVIRWNDYFESVKWKEFTEASLVIKNTTFSLLRDYLNMQLNLLSD